MYCLLLLLLLLLLVVVLFLFLMLLEIIRCSLLSLAFQGAGAALLRPRELAAHHQGALQVAVFDVIQHRPGRPRVRYSQLQRVAEVGDVSGL